MINTTELGDYLATAIKQAKPKPLGNTKPIKADRRNYWLEAVATLERPQNEVEQADRHVSHASYIEPTASEAMAIIKAFATPGRF